MDINRKNGIIYIIVSVVISWILNLLSINGSTGLGVVVNYYFPPILGIITLALFLVLSYINHEEKFIRLSAITFIVLNLVFALYFSFEGLFVG